MATVISRVIIASPAPRTAISGRHLGAFASAGAQLPRSVPTRTGAVRTAHSTAAGHTSILLSHE